MRDGTLLALQHVVDYLGNTVGKMMDMQQQLDELSSRITAVENNISTLTTLHMTHVAVQQDNLDALAALNSTCVTMMEIIHAINSKRSEDNEKYEEDLRSQESETGILCDAARGEVDGGGQSEAEEDGA